MTSADPSQAVTRGILEALSDERLILSVPGTEYQLHLAPTVPASQIKTPIGKRIKGTIHGRALRIFKASGGGKFIEPISGEPRIVAGTVVAIDEPNRRLLIDVAVPLWLTLEEGQSPTEFEIGDLVNCYVASGAAFTPA